MVHGKNRIPYWIERRLTGLAGPDYDATISFGLPFEPEDSQYGKYRLVSYEAIRGIDNITNDEYSICHPNECAVHKGTGFHPGKLRIIAKEPPAQSQRAKVRLGRSAVTSRPMTAGEITVREAAPDDIGTLVAFQQATARETEGKDLDSQVATKGVSAVFQPPDRGFYLVAETGGRVVGGLLITYGWSDWRNATFWWIQSLYVEPQWRRNGAVYRALHDHVHSLATSHQGVSGLRLQVERRHCVAQQTYANLGMARSQYDLLEMDFLP